MASAETRVFVSWKYDTATFDTVKAKLAEVEAFMNVQYKLNVTFFEWWEIEGNSIPPKKRSSEQQAHIAECLEAALRNTALHIWYLDDKEYDYKGTLAAVSFCNGAKIPSYVVCSKSSTGESMDHTNTKALATPLINNKRNFFLDNEFDLKWYEQSTETIAQTVACMMEECKLI